MTKGGADPTFASAKVKNAIGRIGIFYLIYSRKHCCRRSDYFIAFQEHFSHCLILLFLPHKVRSFESFLEIECGTSFDETAW